MIIDTTEHLTFDDGIFPEYKYTVGSEFIEGKYKVDENIVSMSYRTEESIFSQKLQYNVDYASDNLLIFKYNNSDNLLNFKIFKAKSSDEDHNYELRVLAELYQSYANFHLSQSKQLFEKQNALNGDLEFIKAIDYLKIREGFDSNFNRELSSLYKEVNELRKMNSSNVENDYMQYFESKISFDPNSSSQYSKYLKQVEPIISQVASIITIRKAENQNTTILEKYLKDLNSDFNRYYDLYSLYGDGDKYLMKLNAIEAIKESMKNPSSFEFVKGYPTTQKTKKGWVYYIRYRGTNSFGGVVTEEKNILLRFDPSIKNYYATKIW